MKNISSLLVVLFSTLFAVGATTYIPSNKNIVIDSVAANVPYTVPDTLKFLVGTDTIVGLYNLNFTVTKLPKIDTVTLHDTVRVTLRDTIKITLKDTISVNTTDTLVVRDTITSHDTVRVTLKDTVFIIPKNFHIQAE